MTELKRDRAVIGVDAGGTKTDAVLATLDGHPLARRVGAPGNYHAMGIEAVRENFASLVSELADEAAEADAVVVASAFCVAGLDRPKDEAILRRVCDELPTGEYGFDLMNDTFAILRAGSDDGHGIGVVSGTGSNCVGIGPSGRRDRIGGLAFMFGDTAGGTVIGVAGLRAAFRGADGRGPRTKLTQLMIDRFELDRLDDMVDFFIVDSAAGLDTAALAPLVFEAANAGDSVAVEIIEDAGRELALSAKILARRLYREHAEFPLVMGGSVLQKGVCDRMRRVLIQEVAAELPGAVPTLLDGPPVVGAVLLAVDRAVRQGLRVPGWPDREVRATLRDELADE